MIYIGGSFDTKEADFKKNAKFWGHLDQEPFTLSLQAWIDETDLFTIFCNDGLP